jgi:hypothetical protein
MTTPNIEKVLASNGVRFFAKDIIREGMKKDCVDAVNDVRLALDLLEERMWRILNQVNQPE